jgi:DNA-directed RNA polymerase specialized sigma24 family protein
MRHGNADQVEPTATDADELTAERELLTLPVREHSEHDAVIEHTVLAERVSTVWRVLRGMGVSDDDVAQAVRISFDQACNALQVQQHSAGSVATAADVPLERVVDPLLAAAFLAARAAWRPLTTQSSDAAESAVSYQGELRVLGLLGTLDEPKRVCLLLADMEQYSSPEIAALTGMRLDVVYDELRKARKTLDRARKRNDETGATRDAEVEGRELLALARTRFSPPTATLASLCDALCARFGTWVAGPRDPGTAA